MIKEFTLNNKGAIKVNLVDSNFGEIRVVIQNKELYFCAKDVCFAFGMRDYKRYVSHYCQKIHHFYHDTNGGVQILNFINFQDVIHICEHSKMENATDLLYTISTFIITMKRVLNYADDYDYCSDCEYRAVCDCDGDCDNCDDYLDCSKCNSKEVEEKVVNDDAPVNQESETTDYTIEEVVDGVINFAIGFLNALMDNCE